MRIGACLFPREYQAPHGVAVLGFPIRRSHQTSITLFYIICPIRLRNNPDTGQKKVGQGGGTGAHRGVILRQIGSRIGTVAVNSPVIGQLCLLS